MKKVMVFGTFDYIHKGHEFFLKEAKKHGDYLIVVIARDTNVLKFKGQAPMFTEDQRKDHIEKLGIANKVFLGYKNNIYQINKIL